MRQVLCHAWPAVSVPQHLRARLSWPRFTLAQGVKQTKMARSTARFSAACHSPIFMATSVTCSRCVCDRVCVCARACACVCVCVRACVCRFVGASAWMRICTFPEMCRYTSIHDTCICTWDTHPYTTDTCICTLDTHPYTIRVSAHFDALCVSAHWIRVFAYMYLIHI